MSAPPVTIYSLSTCAWSRKAKAYFKQRGVDFNAVEYDMAGADLQRKISAEMRQNGADWFPYVKIGGHTVKGCDPARYEKLLKLARPIRDGGPR